MSKISPNSKAGAAALISWEELLLKNSWIVWSPLLYFSFKSFKDPNSLPFIRFQCFLHNSGVLFSLYSTFGKLKRGHQISRESQFCRKSELFSPLFCIYIWNIQGPKFFVIPSILMHSIWFRRSFLRLLEFLQVKEGRPNFWGNQFCWKSELFGSPFSISILKVLCTQSLCHSLDFNAFFMIPE